MGTRWEEGFTHHTGLINTRSKTTFPQIVIPDQIGNPSRKTAMEGFLKWIPAYAGMTNGKNFK
jgi:hypothetical protein